MLFVSLDQAVMTALREHPHHDTPVRLVGLLRGPGVDVRSVESALERLHADGFVNTHGGHWQLSAAGFRVQRAA